MHGMSIVQSTRVYTDAKGDRISLDPIKDEGRAHIALSTAGAHVIYLDVEHENVNVFIAAIRETAGAARQLLREATTSGSANRGV